MTSDIQYLNTDCHQPDYQEKTVIESEYKEQFFL